eukprot:2466276-Amphidinium_carterae.1
MIYPMVPLVLLMVYLRLHPETVYDLPVCCSCISDIDKFKGHAIAHDRPRDRLRSTTKTAHDLPVYAHQRL